MTSRFKELAERLSEPSKAPPSVEAGDALWLVAPSGPFDVAAFERGRQWLTEHYVVRCRDDVLEREGYLAGNDVRRLQELQQALADRDAKAVVAARGGYGAMRLLSRLEPALIRAHPKWLVGFSDITALHAAWRKVGVASIHGAMVASLGGGGSNESGESNQLGRESIAAARRHWRRALRGDPLELRGEPFPVAAPRAEAERVSAPIVGGNLAMITALLGTPFEPDVSGAILLLEDVGERPYRLDRMLTSLELAGWFERAAAIALGSFERCLAGADGVNAERVLTERFSRIDKPVVWRLPVGHGVHNQPLRLGLTGCLDAAAGTLAQAAISGRPEPDPS